MKTLLNIIWLVLAGFWMAIAYLVAAVLLAIFCGVGVGLLLEITDPVLFGIRQLEERYDLPVLGTVPRIS